MDPGTRLNLVSVLGSEVVVLFTGLFPAQGSTLEWDWLHLKPAWFTKNTHQSSSLIWLVRNLVIDHKYLMVDTTDLMLTWQTLYHSANYSDMYTALHLPPPRTPDAAAATECTDEHNEHQESHSNDDNDAESIHWGRGWDEEGGGGEEEGRKEEGWGEKGGRMKRKEVVMYSLLCPTTKWFWHEHSKGSQKPLSAKHGMVTENVANSVMKREEASYIDNSFHGYIRLDTRQTKLHTSFTNLQAHVPKL